MKRYYTQTGSNPRVEGSIHIAGPQAEDQIPPEVVSLLGRPGITHVVVLYNHGLGDRLEIFQAMPEPKEAVK